jgi:hypothetical protein
MPSRTMTDRETELLPLQEMRRQWVAEQNERPSRHRGDREERSSREDKENPGNREHRRHRSVRERGGRDDYHVEKRRHSQMYETAVPRAERHIAYQPGAVQQPCGHYKPSDMCWSVWSIHDQVAHRNDINSPYDYRSEDDIDPRYVSAAPPAKRRSVAINPEIEYVSNPTCSSITSPPPAHIAPPRHSHLFRPSPQHAEYDGTKPLPAPPHPHGPYGPSPLEPELQPPYWMETIGHAIWTLSITVGHLIGTAATSILIFVLGLIHCIMTGVLLVIGTVFDGLTTILRILFNIFTCHFQSGEWGWEWTHLTRAWQWGRKSQWVWETVGRVNTETEERDEKVAKRLSLHEARKEEYKREQEEKAQMQATGPVVPANKRHGVAALYGERSMAYDLEKGFGSGPQPGSSNRVSSHFPIIIADADDIRLLTTRRVLPSSPTRVSFAGLVA